MVLFFLKLGISHNEDQKDWCEAERLIEEADAPFIL
jgi:hypothetical protein